MSYSAIVKGPEPSRRFGRVIRLNLIKGIGARCNFACAYCRSAVPARASSSDWWSADDVISATHAALTAHPDIECIAISGGGEPTLHPAFAVIAEGLTRLRDTRAPHVRLAILSNGSTLDRIEVRRALSHFDTRIMKLDAGDATTYRRINGARVPLGRLIAGLRYLGDIEVMARFVRNPDRTIDNTAPPAVDAWLSVVRDLRPRAVQICGSDWPAGRGALADVPRVELEHIAGRVTALGIPASVY